MATKCIGVMLVVALLAAGCGAAMTSTRESAGSAKSLPGLTPERLEKLRDWSIRESNLMGEPHPTAGVVIWTTQHHFYELSNGPTFGTPDFDAYVVSYNGDFVAGIASRPAGAPAPRGHVVYAVYNAETLNVTDWGVGNLRVEPEKIGPWVPLDLG